MHTNKGNTEMYHELIFLQSPIITKIINETKLDFLEAMEILQTQEIKQLKSLVFNHKKELSQYFDKNLLDVNKEKVNGPGLYLYKEIFKKFDILSKYSEKITLGNIIIFQD